MREVDIKKKLDAEVERLRAASVGALDPCVNAKAVAAADEEVQTLFIRKIGAGNQFKGLSCIGRASPEERLVVFQFECAPGEICFINPSFAALVSLTAGKVLQIIESFEHPTQEATAAAGLMPFGLAFPSNAPNVSAPAEAMSPLQEAEQQFFADRGIVPGTMLSDKTTTYSGVMTPSTTSKDTTQRTVTQVETRTPVVGTDDHSAEVKSDTHTDYSTDVTTDQAPDDPRSYF